MSKAVMNKPVTTNVPALRFGEFSDFWVTTTLGKVCLKIQDGNYGGNYPKASEFLESGVPFLTSKAVGTDGNIIREKIDFIGHEKHKELNKAHLKLHDVLFTNRGANVGVIGFVNNFISDGNIGPQLTLLRAKKEKILPLFIRYSMVSFGMIKQIRSQDSGSAMNFFSIGTTSKLKLSVPDIAEQQKIANFLSAVDSKLNTLEKTHAALNRYKRGLMQQLFSQAHRFKDNNGQDFPDWEEKRLGDVAKVFSGGTPSVGHEAYYGGDIPFIKSGEINATRTQQYITQKGLESSSAKHIVKGDLLYALYGATSGEVAISKQSGAINQAVLCIRTDMSKVLLLNWLRCNKGNICSKYLQGGQGNLSADIVKKLRVPLPHPKEQQKIAQALSTLDNKITAAATKITQLKTFKKGLLQQMFV